MTDNLPEAIHRMSDLARLIPSGRDDYIWTFMRQEVGRVDEADQPRPSLRLMVAPVTSYPCLAVYVDTSMVRWPGWHAGRCVVVGIIVGHEPGQMYVYGGVPYIRQLMRDDGIRRLVCTTLHTTVDELVGAARDYHSTIDVGDAMLRLFDYDDDADDAGAYYWLAPIQEPWL